MAIEPFKLDEKARIREIAIHDPDGVVGIEGDAQTATNRLDGIEVPRRDVARCTDESEMFPAVRYGIGPTVWRRLPKDRITELLQSGRPGVIGYRKANEGSAGTRNEGMTGLRGRDQPRIDRHANHAPRQTK
jgi:hypothetical protein